MPRLAVRSWTTALAGSGKLHVGVEPADIIGVTDHVHLQARIVLQQPGDLLQGRFRLGFEHGLAGVEVDAVDGRMAGAADVLGEGVGVGQHVLFHGLLFDDDQVRLGAVGGQLHPDLLVALDELHVRILVIAVQHGAADLPDGVLVIAVDLQVEGGFVLPWARTGSGSSGLRP